MVFNPRLIIPESFEQCFTYETQIAFLARWVGQLADQIGGGGGGSITIDPTPTEGSENAVSSGGTYDAIQTVQTAAQFAASTASEAKTAAEAAQTAAGNAQTAAGAAQSAAESAASAASAAQSTATAAQSTASEAQTAAEEADTKATAAQTTAGQALAGLADKQNTLTFDSTPTEGSNNPVTSAGIKKYVDEHSGGGGGSITIDPTPTEGSENAVSSGGTYDAIQTVQTAAQFAASTASEAKTAAEAAQTAAGNAQTAAGAAQSAAESAASAASAAQSTATAAQSTASEAQTAAEEADTKATAAQTTAGQALAGLADKQNTLTFDSTPTEGSNNPVTSAGIKKYVDEHSGGGGGTAEVKPNRSVKVLDLSFVIDPDGYVQSVDYAESLIVYKTSIAGYTLALINGNGLGGSGDTAPGVAVPLIMSRYFGYLNVAKSGAADLWAQGNGTNNASNEKQLGTSPIVASILRGARYTVVTSDGTTVWTSEVRPTSGMDGAPVLGAVDEATLATPYTLMCSNGVTLFGYRKGYIDVLNPTDWSVIQSVAISDVPLAIRHTGCHLIAICATQCLSYPSGLFTLGTPEKVFTEHYPAAVFDSPILNAGEGWVCVRKNSIPVVVTEDELFEDMIASPWQGGVSITTNAGTSVHLYDFPGGHQLAPDNFGVNSFYMPARRW